MNERWLANELRRKDPYLDGFWAISKGLSDMSGRGRNCILGNSAALDPEQPYAAPRKIFHSNRRGGQYIDNTSFLYAGEAADFNYMVMEPFTVSVWFCRLVDFYGLPGLNNQIPLVAKTSRSGSSLPYSHGWDLTVKSYSNGTGIGTGLGTAMHFRYMTDTYYDYGIGVYAELEPFSTQGLNRWHHLLVVKPSEQASSIIVYYDGRPINVNITHNYANTKGGNVTNRLWMGMKWDEFSTKVVTTPPVATDLIRVWRKALDAKEATDVYQRELMAYDYRKTFAFIPPMESQVDLFMHGFDIQNNSTPLYVSTYSYTYTTNAPPLYTAGTANYNLIDLYVSGVMGQNSSTTLYTVGSPLFQTTDLYVFGIDAKAVFMPLYLEVAPPNVGDVDLFVSGSTAPDIVNNAHLYTSGTIPTLATPMNLFLLGHPSDYTVRNMNLWVEGTNQVTPNSMTLFMKNTQEGVVGSAPLFVQGPGGVPLNEDLFLFLKRPFESGLDLYMKGPGTPVVGPEMTLFIDSAYPIETTTTLVMPNTFGVLNPKTTLYTHGW